MLSEAVRADEKFDFHLGHLFYRSGGVPAWGRVLFLPPASAALGFHEGTRNTACKVGVTDLTKLCHLNVPWI